MTDPQSGTSETKPGLRERWNRFWFAPEPVVEMARLRGAFCLLAALYFASAWPDADFWYGEDGVQSSSRMASFLMAAGLDGEARWYVSPLFLLESTTGYRAYLAAGVLLSGVVLAGYGGRLAGFVLWAMMVGLANRALFLAGLVETLLSLALFASAIAPAAPAWYKAPQAPGPACWTAGFARKWIAIQVTVLAVATTATMLAGAVWWNGLGAFALAAPVADRTMDWTTGPLAEPLVHDLVTHLLVVLLPLGVVSAWRRPSLVRSLGPSLVPGRLLMGLWCITIALLGSFWLYAATFGVMAMAIRPRA